ncbi:MAG: divalent-cation tolerance protein CutA [Patescibacteria group bacterium]
MKNDKIIFIYTTFPNKKSAEKLIEKILKNRLAACLNYWPIFSQYLWNKKIEKSNEWALIIKTVKKNYQKIEKLIKKYHPYEIPAILSWPMTKGEKNYWKWLINEIK